MEGCAARGSCFTAGHITGLAARPAGGGCRRSAARIVEQAKRNTWCHCDCQNFADTKSYTELQKTSTVFCLPVCRIRTLTTKSDGLLGPFIGRTFCFESLACLKELDRIAAQKAVLEYDATTPPVV